MLGRFQRWLIHHKREVRAPTTADKYTRYARAFMRDYDPLLVSQEAVRGWYEGLLARYAPPTVNAKLASIRALFQFLDFEGLRSQDPTEGLNFKSGGKRLPKPIAQAEIDKIIEKLNKAEGVRGVRDRALFHLAYGSGLRRTEIAKLRLSWIENRDVLSVIGKGDKERKTFMTDVGYSNLRDYVLYAFDLEGDSNEEKDLLLARLVKQHPNAPVWLDSNEMPVCNHRDPGYWVWVSATAQTS
jgi:site-specific recombinase XerD